VGSALGTLSLWIRRCLLGRPELAFSGDGPIVPGIGGTSSCNSFVLIDGGTFLLLERTLDSLGREGAAALVLDGLMVSIAGSIVDAGSSGFGIKASEASLLLLIVRCGVVELDVVEGLSAYSLAFTTNEPLLEVVPAECSLLSWTTIAHCSDADVFRFLCFLCVSCVVSFSRKNIYFFRFRCAFSGRCL
jgi:hypothetical protein